MEKGMESYLRFLKGDQAEMKTIVECYWDGMLLYTNSIVHNLSDAEDIAQEALIRLTVRRPHFQEEYQLKAYLLRICRTQSLNHLKKQKRVRPLPPESPELSEETDDIVDVEERMDLAGAKQKLYHALRLLRREYREVLYLRYFAELSIKEISGIMKYSEKHTTAVIYQAKQQLRTILEKEGYSGENL